ncbi:2953_t:CDS:2 [Scutellospora calospora]|uniref:2953_t:CDS:1 n=1 Tax=Scutellospora calospora TaxID=85575 RepID=A0ACA9KAB8_9GLOM|nr:2953_t:CDS:2 [Scutellospora calospora]
MSIIHKYFSRKYNKRNIETSSHQDQYNPNQNLILLNNQTSIEEYEPSQLSELTDSTSKYMKNLI